MTVRSFEKADGRIVDHGEFGGFPEVGDLEAGRQLADVLVGAAAERVRDGAQHVSDGGLAQAPVDDVLRYDTNARVALPVGDLFDVRLDELRAMHQATLPGAFER
jgi:hypothetical protein